jgi:hypothetical protein
MLINKQGDTGKRCGVATIDHWTLFRTPLEESASDGPFTKDKLEAIAGHLDEKATRGE